MIDLTFVLFFFLSTLNLALVTRQKSNLKKKLSVYCLQTLHEVLQEHINQYTHDKYKGPGLGKISKP